MINPAEIPQIPGDMDALYGHATSLRSAGGSFASTGASVHSTWQGLSAVYDAPEVGELLNATKPVSEISDAVGNNVEVVAGALSAYATTVKPIKARLEALKAQAQAFVTSVQNDDDWREDEGKVQQHTKLLSDVNQAVAEWMAAQRTCANSINGVYGGTQYVADNGDGHRAPNEFGYSAAQLNAATASETGVPWGKAEEHDGGFWGDVGDFFVGIKDGAVQMVTDLGALIGYSNGEWSWSTAGAAWKGLGTFALAAAVYGNPVTMGIGGAIDQTLAGGKLRESLVNAGKGIIAYDQWGKGHNGRAAGQATFNVVSAVVGTKGAGGALRGAGAALQGGKVAGVAAKVGSGMVRAGDFVAKMPTVGELGIKVANKLDITIPNLGPTPALAGDGPGFGHRVDTNMPDTRGPDVTRTDGDAPRVNGPSVGDAFNPPGNHVPDNPSRPPDSAGHLPDQHLGGRTPTPDAGHLPDQHVGGRTPESTTPPVPDGHLRDSQLSGRGDGNAPSVPEGHLADQRLEGRPATPDAGHLPDHELGGRDGTGHGDLTPETPDGRVDSPDTGTPDVTDPPLPERLGNQPDGSWVNVEHGSRYALSSEMNAVADRYLDGARVTEGHVSPAIRSIADGVDGAHMRGYPDYVLKGEDSFKRKFAQELAKYPDLTPDEVLANVKDSVRYTIEMPPGGYVDGVVRAVEDLRARGYENVTFKPTWSNPDTYKGVNSTWRDPATGRIFELQFHTPDSFKAKMDTHPHYEAERVAKTEAERLQAAEKQAELFRQVEVPDGVVGRMDELKHTLDADNGRIAPTDLDPAPHDHQGPDGDPGGDTSDSSPADPGDGDPLDPPGATDWSKVAGTTSLNSKTALHAGTASPADAHRYIQENHPYVLEVNADRFRRGVPGSDQNCSRCVWAVDRGFTGSPASALPWPQGPGWGMSHYDFNDYARMLGGDPADYRRVSSYDDIISDVDSRGVGSRGMVYVSRNDGSAHVFNVVRDDNGVVFLDGQTGSLGYLEPNVDMWYLPIGK